MRKWVLSNPEMIIFQTKPDWPQIPIYLQVWKGTCAQNPKPDLFSLLFKASSVSVPLGQLSVSGNPSAIMLFYRAVRGGCLETAALSCPDNISLCVVHHTPTYLYARPNRLQSWKTLKGCIIALFGLLGLSRRRKSKNNFLSTKSLGEIFVKVAFISIYHISKKSGHLFLFNPSGQRIISQFSEIWPKFIVLQLCFLFSSSV